MRRARGADVPGLDRAAACTPGCRWDRSPRSRARPRRADGRHPRPVARQEHPPRRDQPRRQHRRRVVRDREIADRARNPPSTRCPTRTGPSPEGELLLAGAPACGGAEGPGDGAQAEHRRCTTGPTLGAEPVIQQQGADRVVRPAAGRAGHGQGEGHHRPHRDARGAHGRRQHRGCGGGTGSTARCPRQRALRRARRARSSSRNARSCSLATTCATRRPASTSSISPRRCT